ncbi:hypothetical protein MOBT1_003052 [Malassezia obtusa]|uniref:WW domain-containing protein n=1 Tax=Malassezia obtusa TaxID=76774 RepID=A0AAF0E3G3_9BASI|nr:hypothetical protein MOBT1_003052 [Malassezia obtusa]
MDAERPREKVPIPGTDGWLRVTTTHGNVFYAQKKTKRSEWTVPDEIREQVEAMEGPKVKRVRTASPPPAAPSAAAPSEEDIEEEEELTPAPAPAPQAAPIPAASIPATPELSFEEGRALFMNMLTSLNGTAQEINPMAPWDRELPKFVHLHAYSALPSTRDREEVFNEWCKLRLREKRARRAPEPAKPTQRPDGTGSSHALYSLFRKHVVSTRSTFDDVKRKFGTDPSFTRVGEAEARSIFDAWIQELSEIKRTLAKKADAAFLALLSEKLPSPATLRQNAGFSHPDKEQAATIWASAKKTDGLVQDKRYDAVGSATRRAELFASWVRDEALAKPDVPHTQPAPTARDPDPVHPSVPKEPSDAAARRERALQQRQQQVRRDHARMHERNRAARTDVAAEQRENDFRQLLLDSVRDPCLAWEDARQLLSRDERFAPSGIRDVLSDETKRVFFDEHVQHLQDKRRDQLARLFAKHTTDERGAEQLAVDMDSVLALVRHDEDFNNAGLRRFVGEDAGAHRSLNTSLEREFQEWDRWRHERARAEFVEMLKENAFVDFWGRLRKEKEQHAHAPEDMQIKEDDDIDPEGVSVFDMASHVDLAEMESVLKNDKRYRIFAHVPEQRTEWIKYMLL